MGCHCLTQVKLIIFGYFEGFDKVSGIYRPFLLLYGSGIRRINAVSSKLEWLVWEMDVHKNFYCLLNAYPYNLFWAFYLIRIDWVAWFVFSVWPFRLFCIIFASGAWLLFGTWWIFFVVYCIFYLIENLPLALVNSYRLLSLVRNLLHLTWSVCLWTVVCRFYPFAFKIAEHFHAKLVFLWKSLSSADFFVSPIHSYKYLAAQKQLLVSSYSISKTV